MNERDLIIERLEKKLAEKEKEIKELKRVAGMNVEELKSEIISEIRKELEKVRVLEAKVSELNKTVESLMDEILYLKSELSTREQKSREIREILSPEEESREAEEKEDSDEIIVVD
ncbi:hypothetical protein [Geoglobus acetivorans]|uniref:Uncharacterized protein n=1 Tax=Geoglobus acetivorans TaxID=565033 RepID=A0A0A7GEP1_GEOAI|nr:hypothetical protein GACE_1476 [Geoglobus acetivorans]